MPPRPCQLEEPIDPYSGAHNLVTIRARAEAVASEIEQHQPNPLEIGYMVVFASLSEAANQIRNVANEDLTAAQLNYLADLLDTLAEYTIDLGETHTQSRQP